MTASKGRRSLRRLFRSFGELSPDFVGRGSDLLAGSVFGSASKIVFIILYVLPQKVFAVPANVNCRFSTLPAQ